MIPVQPAIKRMQHYTFQLGGDFWYALTFRKKDNPDGDDFVILTVEAHREINTLDGWDLLLGERQDTLVWYYAITQLGYVLREFTPLVATEEIE